MKFTRRTCLALLGTGLAATQLPGCAATGPRSADSGPFRTSTVDGEAGVMLEGHDAVAYFTQNQAVKGRADIRLEHLGVVWRFASAANRDAFQARPEAYRPQFNGFCSNGINYAVPWGGGGGPESWRIYRGKLYVFGGQKARDHFEMDTETNLARAHKYWDEEVAGSNALLTRMRRLVLRVPHYRSDASLQAEWEARRAAGTLPVMPGRPQVVPREP